MRSSERNCEQRRRLIEVRFAPALNNDQLKGVILGGSEKRFLRIRFDGNGMCRVASMAANAVRMSCADRVDKQNLTTFVGFRQLCQRLTSDSVQTQISRPVDRAHAQFIGQHL